MVKTEKSKHLSAHIIAALIVLVATLIILMVFYSIIGIFITRIERLEIYTVDREKIYDGTPLTGEECIITSGRLGVGHSISILSNAQITAVGEVENTLEMIVVDELGENVSSLYDIHVTYGTLRVLPREIGLSTASAQKVYDGTPLTGEDYSITYGELGAGHSIRMLSIAEITAVGEVENTPEMIVVNELGENVSQFYDIQTTYGTLRIVPRKIGLSTASGRKEYDGTPFTVNEVINTTGGLLEGDRIVVTGGFSATECGVYESRVEYFISNAQGFDVTDMYDIVFNYGKVEIAENIIRISTGSASRPYDGTPLVNETWDMSGSLVSGDHVEVHFTQSLTNVGVAENVPEVSVFDGFGKDVTSHYSVVIQPGQLEVTPLPITIRTDTVTKVYDGLPLKQTSWELVSGRLVPSHSMEAIGHTEITDVGTIPNNVYFSIKDANGVEVVSNYKIGLIEGSLTVQPRPITIQTGSASKSYDGKGLSNDTFTVVSGSLCSGHKATIVGEILNGIGYTKNIPQSFKIAETVSGSNGPLTKDVTSNYSVTYQYGTLMITK